MMRLCQLKSMDIILAEVSEWPVDEELAFFKDVSFDEQDEQIARPITKEITDRLSFLTNVGLDCSNTFTGRTYVIWWGSPANSLGHANWIKSIRGHVCS